MVPPGAKKAEWMDGEVVESGQIRPTEVRATRVMFLFWWDLLREALRLRVLARSPAISLARSRAALAIST